MYIASEGANAAQAGQESDGGNGDLWVLKPGPDGAEVVSHTVLKGRAYGSPIGYNGKVYLQTDQQLYAWGKPGNNPSLVRSSTAPFPKAGPATQLQAIPYEVLLRPGQTQSFRIRSLDANGFTVSESIDPKSVKWEKIGRAHV